MKKQYYIASIVMVILISSCTSYKSLLNYHETPKIPTVPQEIQNYRPLKIETNDVLTIKVSSRDQLSLAPFTHNSEVSDKTAPNTFLVGNDGTIIFPTIGKINVRGMTTDEAQQEIKSNLKPYFQEEPIVQLSLSNFKINVNGEVRNPGVFVSRSNKLSIVEAMTLAGDFTPYSRRDSILIIREENGFREFGYVNFKNADLFNSEYFYLKQNDVVYVQPQTTKISTVRDPANRILPWLTAAVTIIALTFSITR